ncbi:hypothetical protein ACVXG9_23690 [Escherichia coli]
MKQVCVLGNGQLGRYAASGRRTVRHCCLASRAGTPTGGGAPFQQSVITAEIERAAGNRINPRAGARYPAFVNRVMLPIIADRLTQKQLLISSTCRLHRGSYLPNAASGLRCLIV